MSNFEKLIRTRGVNSALKVLDERMAAVLKRFGLDNKQYKKLQNNLEEIKLEYRSAFELFRKDAETASTCHVKYPKLENETQAEWIKRRLREEGGEMYGPDLYDQWEGSRKVIQSVVSQLITKKQIIKSKQRGRRGSMLRLKKSSP